MYIQLGVAVLETQTPFLLVAVRTVTHTCGGKCNIDLKYMKRKETEAEIFTSTLHSNQHNPIDTIHNSLNFDPGKSFMTAKKSILRLVKLHEIGGEML